MTATEDLIGHSTFYDRISQILFGGTVELYADRDKAIVRVLSLDDPDRKDEIVFYVPNAVLAVHMIIAVFKEVTGLVEEEPPAKRTRLAICPNCSGLRYGFDDDMNIIECPVCEAEGMVREEIE